MKAAIYSRKSKYTGKGESIENQIQLCREYAIKYLEISEDEFIVYEDEGFSGGNTNRPQFQEMMNDARNGEFNILICYRLDRISRNVSDFSVLIKELNKNNINFVSIREQFDTTTPMGRAMMYIASVFSQLERETIAERIRDNMLELAKTGRWLGGIPPTGFSSEAITIIDSTGKQRKMYKLSTVKEEVEIVKLIFDRYEELKSITKVEKFLLTNGITTKNGVEFKRYSIKFILSNPVYAVADSKVYNYLINKGYEIYADSQEFNGVHGLIGYNKTYQKKEDSISRIRDINEWIIAVGKHKGIISSNCWIEVQQLLEQNKSKAYRKPKSTLSLLSGIIKCSNCGSYMRPKAMQRQDCNGEQVFYYMCERKEKSKGTCCNIKNINGNLLDKLILNEFVKVVKENQPIVEKSSKSEQCFLEEGDWLKKRVADIDLAISNLIGCIEKGQSDSIQKITYRRLEKLSMERDNLIKKISERDNTNEKFRSDKAVMKEVLDKLLDFNTTFLEVMSIEVKRNILRNTIEKILWDGEKIDVLLSCKNVSVMNR